MTAMTPDAANWLNLFTHFASLSLLGVGGAISTRTAGSATRSSLQASRSRKPRQAPMCSLWPCSAGTWA